MKKLGLMKPAGLKAYRDVLENPHLAYSNEKDGSVNFPEDLMEALKSGIRALNNFMLFPPSSQRMYIEWLNSAKQKETRERRIERILRMSESNTRPGMM
jgi:uncharacterized protein YdeI (YjbR/CyaY-like superfamily)